MSEKAKRILLSGWPAAFVLGLTLVLFLHQSTLLHVGEAQDEMGTIAQVRDLIVDNWVEDPGPRRDRLRYGAVEGMASQLDPYSGFIPPERRQRFDEDISGEFAGLGIQMEIDKGQVLVMAVMEDTPAWRAGALPDDRVIEVDGVAYEFNSPEEAQKKLRGKVGSKVNLLVSNPRRAKNTLLTIERGTILTQSVKGTRILEAAAAEGEPAPRIGYLAIRAFQNPTVQELDKGIADLTSNGMAALVVDLRGNPGGVLKSAVDIASRFLEKGDTVVITRGRNRTHEERTSADPAPEAPRIRVPVAILIDGESASASEVLAGALRDYDRAVLVGSRSLGKGSVQSIYPIDNGKAKLKLTTQYWYTPHERKIHRTEKATEKDVWGLLPDLPVAIDQGLKNEIARQEGELEIELLRKKRDPGARKLERSKPVNDPQLDAAVAHLTKVLRKESLLVPPETAHVTSGDAIAPPSSNH